MTKFRAIENGFNIVKNTFAGVGLFCDFNGRVLNYHRATSIEQFFYVSDIYMKGRKTLYSYIGIFWNYFYIIAALIIFFIGMQFDFSLYRNYHPVETGNENQNSKDENGVSPRIAKDVPVVSE